MLADNERLRGIFHPNDHQPVCPDPTGSIEEWPTVELALEVFRERATRGRGATHYVGEPPAYTEWFEADGTAYMDVWIETVETEDEGEAPGVPNDMWQRWTLAGDSVHRDNF